jgi:hypothetical protein
MITAIRRSPAYRALHQRLRGPRPPWPCERWLEDGRVHVIFELETPAALALFVLDAPTARVLLVRTIVSDPDERHARVTDLFLVREDRNDGTNA